MKLPIVTNERKFFRQVLELLRGIPPLDKLRNKELDLLAGIMFYNYLYRNLGEDIRWRVINNKTTKKELREYLGMGEDVYNNNISIIRKTGLVDSAGRLSKALQIIPESTFKIEFEFKIEKNEL
jgi:hypothetical protein